MLWTLFTVTFDNFHIVTSRFRVILSVGLKLYLYEVVYISDVYISDIEFTNDLVLFSRVGATFNCHCQAVEFIVEVFMKLACLF